MTEAGFDVVAVGEVMGLLDPDDNGPLEDVSGFRLRVAGAEGNVLISLARLGHSTALVSAVGADPVGRLVTRTLAEQGVNVDHVHVDPAGRTGVFFKERLGSGDRRVYYYRDGSAASRLTPQAVDLEKLGVPRVLTVSGLTLGLGGDTGLATVARAALSWATARGCTVVFDANLRPHLWDGPRAVREFAEIVPHVDVLLAGREELAVLLPAEDPDRAARRLARSTVSAVVLKDGAKGAVVYEGDEVTPIAPFPVDVVIDPVGAGDAFAAGVISGLLHGWPVGRCARVGAVLGARAITVSGDWEATSAGLDARQLLEQYTATVARIGGAA
jgi:2-dehydro-3-deoxygluconokinase